MHIAAISATLMFFSTPSFADQSKPAISNSVKYQSLVEDNEAQMRFTDGQNAKLDRYLRSSPHFSSVMNTVTALYSGATVRKLLTVDATHQIQWVDQGLGNPSVVNLIDTTLSAPTVLLYSTFTDGIGISAAIDSVSLSPNADYLVVAIADYGSIDQVQAVVIDIARRSEVQSLDLGENDLTWTSPTTLQYYKLEDDGSSTMADFDVTSLAESDPTFSVMGISQNLLLIQDVNGSPAHFYLLNNKTGLKVAVSDPGDATMVGSDSSRIYFLSHKDSLSTISAMNLGEMKTLVADNSVYFEQVRVDEGLISVQTRAGANRWLRFYSPNGALIRETPVPDCCSIANVSWSVAGKSVAIAMTSAIVASGHFILDLASGNWDKDPTSTMLTADGVTYKNEVFNSTSEDGTVIPSRLIYRSDLKSDGSHAVMMESYGGFGIRGYVDPSFDRPTLAFLKQGGMFAGPALRGGDEFGPTWHEQAMLQNKIKTFQDLDAVAKQLVTNGWTTAKKIAIKGTSNGGLTTAATALLFPNDFGLAIPIAGVDDLLAKDVLDSVNDGWTSEYGSDQDGASYLTAESPLENVSRQGAVRFLIVDGAEDTRVNPAHSVKLAKALLDQGGNPANAFLLTVANAGHGVESIGLQNSIGLKTEIVVWTMIYDLAGF